MLPLAMAASKPSVSEISQTHRTASTCFRVPEVRRTSKFMGSERRTSCRGLGTRAGALSRNRYRVSHQKDAKFWR